MILTEPVDLKVLELKHDPTHLSDISQRYQQIVQFLIDCNVDELLLGSAPEMLDEFRATYLDTAYICRYRNCPRFAEGFHTADARDEHEKGHIKPLRCADPLCAFFDRGFNSRTGLAKHNKKYHPKPEEVEPPSFESIKAPKPVLVPPPLPAQAPAPSSMSTPSRSPTPPPVPLTKKVEKVKKVKEKRKSRAKRGLPVHHCATCSRVCFHFSNLLT